MRELLTSSARAYAATQSRKLSNYTMVGLSVLRKTKMAAEMALDQQASNRGCVVIVDIRETSTRGGFFSRDKYSIRGTGLLPRG